MTPTRGTYVLGVLLLVTLTWVFAVSLIAQASRLLAAVGLSAGLAVILAGGVMTLRTSGPMPRVRVVDVVMSTTAAGATLYLCRVLDVPPLVACALVITVIGVAMLSGGPLDVRSGMAAYTGGFIGIISPNITLSWFWVILAGPVAGVLWSLIAPSAFVGVGGRMGATAFMASAGVYQAADLLGDRDIPPLLPPPGGLANWAVVPIGATSALVVWLLMNRLGWSLPMASGLSSLLVCGGLALWGPSAVATPFATAWFGGNAVGAVAARRLPNAGWVAIAGLLFGAMTLRFQGPLQGHVGAIGSFALMGEFGAIALRRGLQAVAPRLPGQPRVA